MSDPLIGDIKIETFSDFVSHSIASNHYDLMFLHEWTISWFTR